MRKTKLYAVLGLGVFGSTVAQTLSEKGYDVIAIDKDISCVDRVVQSVTHANVADITDIDQLRQIGVANCDVAVVSLSSQLEASIIAILNLQKLGVPYIVAKAKNKQAMQILERIGVDKIVRPERDMGERIAKSLMSQNILDIADIDDNYSIIEMKIPAAWVDKSILELNLRNKYGVNIIGIKRINDEKMKINFDITKPLKPETSIYMVANTNNIGNFNFD